MSATKRQRAISPTAADVVVTGVSAASSGGAGLDIQRLEKVRERNGKTIAACPACREAGADGDGDHLWIGADGRFGCVANPGDAGHAHRQRIFQLVGMQAAPAPRPPQRKARVTRAARTWDTPEAAATACTPEGFILAAVYDYPRAGLPFAAVARYENGDGKTFRQFHLDGDAWAAGAPAGLWPLYGIESLPATGALYCLEGEKAHAAAVSIGLPCVTSAGGSKAAEKTDWRPLQGRDAVILPDADAPGAVYAEAVKGALSALQCRIRVVVLPGLPVGGDVVEWIAAHGDAAEPDSMRAEIESMAAAAEPSEDAGRIEIINAADWLRTLPPKSDFVLRDTFDTGDKVAVIGASKQRKSFFVLQMGMHLSSGYDFLKWESPKARRVLLCQFEVKAAHFHSRVYYMGKAVRAEPGDRLGIRNGRGQSMTCEDIRRTALQHKAEVIIIDPLYKLLEGDENSAQDVKPVLAAFDRMAEETGAAVVYVHHDGKGNSYERDTRDRGAGSGVLGRDYDCCITLTSHRDEPDGVVIQSLLRNYAPQPAFTAVWGDGCFTVADTVLPVVGRAGKYDDAYRGFIRDNPEASLTDIAGAIGCDKSTASRLRGRLGVA